MGRNKHLIASSGVILETIELTRDIQIISGVKLGAAVAALDLGALGSFGSWTRRSSRAGTRQRSCG